MNIRPAVTTEDAFKALTLIRLLAEYENLAGPDDAAAQRFIDDATAPEPRRFELFLAETDGEAVGYALCFQTYSTFLCKPSLYLEDIFVAKPWRGKGFGKALLSHCIELAKSRGCGRVEWTVLDWNTPAQEFYQSLRAKHLSEWQLYRLLI